MYSFYFLVQNRTHNSFIHCLLTLYEKKTFDVVNLVLVESILL